jgi:hypothetical protein
MVKAPYYPVPLSQRIEQLDPADAPNEWAEKFILDLKQLQKKQGNALKLSPKQFDKMMQLLKKQTRKRRERRRVAEQGLENGDFS